MDLSKLERYAPKARIDFIQAVSARASKLGITNNGILEAKESGDALIIGGLAFPSSIAHQRESLVKRVENFGFEKVIEEVAYTWFNRFTALRYMEVHGYIEEHPFSLFESSEGGSEPEVILHVADLSDWEELNFNLALDLKTQNQTEELYRLILIAQCRSLSKVIPFLFSYHGAEVDLLLPDGLLLSDSLISEMTEVLSEENLQEVESLGWLYQFYIAEKKDALMKAKKAYKTDEIPAVTQLFTPNWIVKYLTQNSIGRLWLSVYPTSPLKEKMEYYIEPAEQTDAVNKQLAEITPDSFNPEEITVLDPACGSGHILVEAYNLLKEIYLERGYQEKEIPRLVLKNNLFGLDIDDRAAQLARFVLLMRARQDDKRLFRLKDEIQLNVHAIQETNGFNLSDFKALGIDGVEELIATFQDAKTYGSLIELPNSLKMKLEQISSKVLDVSRQQSFDSEYAKYLIPLTNQAAVLGQKYDVVVANPPYLGGKGMNGVLKTFAKNNFKESKSDLFAMFIQHGFKLAKSSGFNAMVTMQSWMFLSSYEKMRQGIVSESTIECMSHMGNGVMRIAFGTNATVFRNNHIIEYKGSFSYLEAKDLNGLHEPKKFPVQNERLNVVSADEFKKIPGSPIAYWVSSNARNLFKKAKHLKSIGDTRQGMATSDNNRFLRFWWEIDINKIKMGSKSHLEAKESNAKWFPIIKGGVFRKWFGNNDYVVNWENDGFELKEYASSLYGSATRTIKSISEYFKENISWSRVTSGSLSLRYYPKGFIFSDAGSCIFFEQKDSLFYVLAYLNSPIAKYFAKAFSATITYESGQIAKYPVIDLPNDANKIIQSNVKSLIQIAKDDWNRFEISWDFNNPIWIDSTSSFLEKSFHSFLKTLDLEKEKTLQLELSTNKLLIDSYGLQDETSPKIKEDEVTLLGNPKYRYSGSNLTNSQLAERFRLDTIKELFSYSIGCMVGRYSLNEQGLIYAHSDNEGFDASKYKAFPVDDDGIITLSDMEDLMIRDDLVTRFSEFLYVVWGKETLSENLKFVADTLGSKTDELPKETIRRWISSDFFKDHLQRYKNRPIYWLFSSGKKKAFEALVYLHRYNESTLSRMRMTYVVPLQSRISNQLETVKDDIASASTASDRKRFTQKQKLLGEKEIELKQFDETLRHLADQQIKIDLDDGVKANYGMFPGLLAETKKVCGK
jgi:type II restriction/modification system DNA methylase subunit YeeA